MKHPVEHLWFPESTVEAVTEFRQGTGQVLWTDAMMHTTNIALDSRLCGSPGHRSQKMVFGTSLPGENPGRFLFLEPNPLISRMMA